MVSLSILVGPNTYLYASLCYTYNYWGDFQGIYGVWKRFKLPTINVHGASNSTATVWEAAYNATGHRVVEALASFIKNLGIHEKMITTILSTRQKYPKT